MDDGSGAFEIAVATEEIVVNPIIPLFIWMTDFNAIPLIFDCIAAMAGPNMPDPCP